MKIAIYLWLMISMFSCSKDSTSTTPSVSAASYIKMKINGAAWKGEDGFISGISAKNYLGNAVKNVNGKLEAISIALYNLNTSITTTINKDSQGGFLFIENGNTITWQAGDGVEGNFEFKVTKSKTIGTTTLINATFSGTATDTNGKSVVITEGEIYNEALK